MNTPETTARQVPVCSFCGEPKSAKVPLIAGNDGHICQQCVKLAFQVISTWSNPATPVEPQQRTPHEIKDFLDHYVIGQDEAKRILAVSVYNHYLRLHHRALVDVTLGENGDDSVELEKSNILMVGPSGTGKTLLVRTLARIIGVPFVIGDATTLTQAGYVGDDVDSLLKRLLEAAGGDAEAARWGIVYIDEVDKLARSGGGGASVRDVSGEGVQQALLKMVEGSEFRFNRSGRRGDGGEEVVLDTGNILFIVGGAFPGLTDLVKRRMSPKKTGIGFSAELNKKDDTPVREGSLLEALEPDDLLKFGLIPEFIGRFPVISFLEDLDVESLRRILTEPRNALTRQYAQLFRFQNVELIFSDAALTYIAQQAVERRTGARGLRAMLENLLQPVMFDLPSTLSLKACHVDIEEIDGGASLTVQRTFKNAEEMAAAVEADSKTDASDGNDQVAAQI
ncbi:MAG: ATP-dependent Clp protease ATP-binding subunit ClpX [Pseudomonas sp.]|nr:ATP-dependent Clp protease ATP-binding subunit ClpX [Pseudomonas sp.]